MDDLQLVSFDIFDTLITRKVATPKGLFAIVAHKINNPEFIPLRIYAEYRATNIGRDAEAKEDITLYDIYEAMKDFANAYNIEKWMSIEIETELDMSVPIRKNIELALSYVRKGIKVVFISDMYLPCEIIRKMLVNAEPTFADIDVIVSGEYGKLKSTWNLYKTVQKKYSVDYSNWLHHGDNIVSDVEAAKKLGIKTKLLMFDGLGQREEYVLSNRETDANFQLAVGISRNLRNFGKAHLGYSCGVFYGGVVLLEYTWNILKKSVEMGFKTLYFIARDGYIPKMIAEYLIDKFNLDIKTRYIYMSITSIIDAFEIPENKDIVNDYLKQEINPNDKFAFVDIGGGGGTVNTIGHFLGMSEIFTFYLVYNMPNLHRYKGKERIVKMITFSQCPHYFIHESWRLEILFTAPHGRTTGYKREKDKVVPIMLENNIGELYPAYSDYIDGVMDFVHEYAGYIGKNPLSDVSYAVINSLMKNDEYSKFFGEMPHEIYEKFSNKLSLVEKFDLSLLNIESTHLPVSPYGTGFRKKLFERFERLRELPPANAYKYIRAFYSKITKRSHNFFTSWNRNLYGKNVVLYGSGAEAQRMHSLVLINNMCKIVQWVNKEKHIAQILQKDFDYVLVAIDDVSVVRETANNLVTLGIPKEIIHSSKYGRVL